MLLFCLSPSLKKEKEKEFFIIEIHPVNKTQFSNNIDTYIYMLILLTTEWHGSLSNYQQELQKEEKVNTGRPHAMDPNITNFDPVKNKILSRCL